MNNLSNSVKKFVSNKNTVTILGVVLCIIILYLGYNFRINQKVSLTKVPYANQTIQPKTEITSSMISYMNVPASFLVGSYYKSAEDLVGKYSNYNTIIAEGSLFYTDLVVDSSVLPDSAFVDLEEGYTPISYRVDMDSTYANSMMPNDYINIYFKAKDDNGTIMFGKFISNVKILDVKDSSGQHVFENTEEARTPAYMLFALPEDMHLLFRKAIYLESSYDVELILVPNTQELTREDTVFVSSSDIQNFINEKTKMVSVDEILSSTADKVDNSNDTTSNDDKKNP
ncbi:MAG: SAF domain-containing protein [Erysipelotrichaceae bacterium]|nr:SAF domain-containing protein [Erysipelotrichaceae bacterium]